MTNTNAKAIILLIITFCIISINEVKSMIQEIKFTFTNCIQIPSSIRGVTYMQSIMHNKSVYVLLTINSFSGPGYPALYKIDPDGSINRMDLLNDCIRLNKANFFIENSKLMFSYSCEANQNRFLEEVIEIDDNGNVKKMKPESIIEKDTILATSTYRDSDLEIINNINDTTVVIKDGFALDDNQFVIVIVKQSIGSLQLPPFYISTQAASSIFVAYYTKKKSPMLYMTSYNEDIDNRYSIKSEKDLFLNLEYSCFNLSEDELKYTELLISEDKYFSKDKTIKLKPNYWDSNLIQFQLSDSLANNQYFLRLINSKVITDIFNTNHILLTNGLYDSYLTRIAIEQKKQVTKRKIFAYTLQLIGFSSLFYLAFLIFNKPEYSKLYYLDNLSKFKRDLLQNFVYSLCGLGASWRVVIDLWNLLVNK